MSPESLKFYQSSTAKLAPNRAVINRADKAMEIPDWWNRWAYHIGDPFVYYEHKTRRYNRDQFRLVLGSISTSLFIKWLDAGIIDKPFYMIEHETRTDRYWILPQVLYLGKVVYRIRSTGRRVDTKTLLEQPLFQRIKDVRKANMINFYRRIGLTEETEGADKANSFGEFGVEWLKE